MVDEVTVRELLDRHMTARKHLHASASVSAAARAVEEVIGKGMVEMSLLLELIAEHAIAHGLAVEFDEMDASPATRADGDGPR